MRRRNDGAGVSPQEEFGDVCFHALGIIDQNREYLQMHLLASADLPTRQALSDIQIESARLDRTVRNAITLYQLENEELSELQPLDLCGLLEKAGRLAPDIQRSLEITLTAESGGIEHCAVMGVPDEAEQLLLHLISNALRACDAGGRVWVSLKQKKTGVALRVEDNGCGLMEEDPIENNRRFLSGAKLGLRICKLICRRAGWKLTLTARPGGGARAQVVFPLASCEDIPPEMELHSGEENDIRAARFASRAAQELLLLRRY
jgi:signal transduction histidine kinase